jgi:predicted phage tail protein
LVTVRAIPRGGGGDGSKGWVGLVAGIVLIIVGVVLAVATWGSLSPFAVPLITAGIGLALGGAYSLLFPPPSLPKLKAGSGADAPVYSITGTRNSLNPYGVIPAILGRHGIFPPSEKELTR